MNTKEIIINIQIETLEEQDKILKDTRKKYFDKMKECEQEERDEFYELAYEYVKICEAEIELEKTLRKLKEERVRIEEMEKLNDEIPF